MSIINKFAIYILILLSYSAIAKNDSIIFFNNDSKLKSLDYHLYIFEDTSSSLSFQEILRNKTFQASTYNVPNFGVSKSTFWIKFSIANKTTKDNLQLQLSYPLMDIADLYYKNASGTFSVIEAGDIHPFSERKYKNPNFIYDITIPQNTVRTFYMKIKGTEQILVPLYIGTSELIADSKSLTDILVGLYIGIIVVMFAYNTVIYLIVKDVNYLYYIIYVLFIGLTQITLLGYASKLLWPNNIWLANHGLYLVVAIGSSAIALFMKSFLNLNTYAPKLVYGVYVIVGMYMLAIISGLVGKTSISYNIIDFAGIIIALFTLYTALRVSMRGYKPGRFFLIGWSVFMIGVFVFILRNLGIFPYNHFTNYTMPVGSALEVTLLSLALADRINILKKEKEESQALAFDALLQNELIIKNQNIILEKKVEERTKELTATIADLKQTQTQLVSSEKMASLGQLTAGIAHEINNPINFVVSNVRPLKKDIEDIYELIQKYENIDPLSSLQNKISEINSFKNEIDYAYLKKEIGSLLKGIEDGAEKTAGIVQGLNVYSRMDETDFKRANILEGINSSLTLLNTEIKAASIELIKNFSDIPPIECFPGKLNQVFMNILNNAIYAIKENKNRIEKGQLIITIHANNYNVYISFKDNGTGMTDVVKAKVFEPFFSTKDAGKGAGLGMSIAYSIINEHNGNIEFNSTYGAGSEFIITLPINYTHKNS